MPVTVYDKKLIRTWDAIANANFFSDDIVNHFYAVRHEGYRILRNNAK